MGFWTDFGLEPDSRPRFLMNKHRRARSEARQKTLRALDLLGLDPADRRAVDPRAYVLASASAIDARLSYFPDAHVVPSRRRAQEMLASMLEDPSMPARYLDVSVEDDRKRKGRAPWASFDFLRKTLEGSLAALDAAEGQGRGFPPEALDDLETRARYLRAQNCLMRAIGPCAFDPAAVVGFAADRRAWALSLDASWLDGVRLPHLEKAIGRVCSSRGADLSGAFTRFVEAWDAYQDEVRRVFCLWKGWLGPRATPRARKDFGLEMLLAYVDLRELCEAVRPTVAAADDTLASFSAIAGSSRRLLLTGREFCPVLDPVTEEERNRRSAQSAAARANARSAYAGDDADHAGPMGAGWVDDDDDVVYAYGTYEDFMRNPMRYPDDFFEPKEPWNR